MKKKDEWKFTIRFNPDDPRQREAAAILNHQKTRSKAAFLTNAILGEGVPVSSEPQTEQGESFELDQKTAQTIADALDMFGQD